MFYAFEFIKSWFIDTYYNIYDNIWDNNYNYLTQEHRDRLACYTYETENPDTASDTKQFVIKTLVISNTDYLSLVKLVVDDLIELLKEVPTENHLRFKTKLYIIKTIKEQHTHPALTETLLTMFEKAWLKLK